MVTSGISQEHYTSGRDAECAEIAAELNALARILTELR
jgi:hypothetical protein